MALLVTVTAPVALPSVVGLKLIESVKACPDARVTGVPAPFTEKPVPLAVIWEICTFEFPEFVTTTLCVDRPLVVTFPKFRLVALNESVCVEAIPVPLRLRFDGRSRHIAHERDAARCCSRGGWQELHVEIAGSPWIQRYRQAQSAGAETASRPVHLADRQYTSSGVAHFHGLRIRSAYRDIPETNAGWRKRQRLPARRCRSPQSPSWNPWNW